MSYKVIHAFTDLQDSNHVYLVGDKFPHDDKVITEERVKELSSRSNKLGEPLIKKTDDDFSQYMNEPEEPLPFSDAENEETKSYTKTDINRMSKEDLVSLANEVGIVGAEDKSGSELKKELIEKFDL